MFSQCPLVLLTVIHYSVEFMLFELQISFLSIYFIRETHFSHRTPDILKFIRFIQPLLVQIHSHFVSRYWSLILGSFYYFFIPHTGVEHQIKGGSLVNSSSPCDFLFLRYSRFQGVANLTLHFSDNFGGDTTKIYYIGLRGEATQVPVFPIYSDVVECTGCLIDPYCLFQNKRDVVATIVYEIMPNPSDHK